MEIRPCIGFQATATVPSADETPRVICDSPDGQAVTLPGAVLEAQFSAGKDYLLFLTEDSPFEEALHIVLLGADLQVLDQLELSAPFTPGLLKELAIVGPGKMSFRFFGPDDRWLLSLFPAPRWLLYANRGPIKRPSPWFKRARLLLDGPS